MSDHATHAAARPTDVVAAPGILTQQPSYVDWSAIAAGTIIAIASGLLLNGFGSALGLYVVTPWSNEGVGATTVTLAAAIWTALVAIYSLAMGAYFTGRMRPVARDGDRDEVSFRDGVNGLVVWALAVILSVSIFASVLSGTARIASSAAGAAGSAITDLAAGSADALAPVGERMIDELLSPAPGNQPTSSGNAQGDTSQPAGAQQSANATSAGSQTNTPPSSQSSDIPSTEPTAQTSRANAAEGGQNQSTTTALPELSQAEREKLMRVARRTLAAGELSQSDRIYLRNLIAEKAGVEPAEAERRIDNTVKATKTELKEATEAVRTSLALSGFWSVLVLLLAGMASWWAASFGGAQRDDALRI